MTKTVNVLFNYNSYTALRMERDAIQVFDMQEPKKWNGIQFIVDDSVPNNEIWCYDKEGVKHRIVNIDTKRSQTNTGDLCQK